MVGWQFDPDIYFYFDSAYSFGAVQLHLSNAHNLAGIVLPSSIDILIGETTLTFTPVGQNAEGAPNEWHSFDTQGLTGSVVKVTLHKEGIWQFMDEAVFLSASDVSGVPEPATYFLTASALALGAFLRRRRS